MVTAQRNPNLNDPDYLTPKGEHIKIGGHISYPYSTDAVMLSSRGEKDYSNAFAMNSGKDPTPAGSVPPLTI